MTTVLLPDDVESRVATEASRRGVDLQTLAVELIERGLSRPAADPAVPDGTAALLERWMAEDADADAAELERQRVDGEAFMRSLDESRRAADGPNARPLWP